MTQPDGSTLRVHDFGDHLAHGTATVQGDYTLVKGGDGAWRYAAGLTATGKLKASSVLAGKGTPRSCGQGPGPHAERQCHALQGPDGRHRQRPRAGDPRPVHRRQHHASGSTEADWAAHYFGASASVDDFYDEASQGQFGLKAATETCGTTPNDGVTGWINLPYAHPNTGVDGTATEQYVADAIKATENCVDYASYDTDPADGQIETNELHVTSSAPATRRRTAQQPLRQEHLGPRVGPRLGRHHRAHRRRYDHRRLRLHHLRRVALQLGEGDTPGHKATIGIMAHEFGHDINWPDLYDTDQDGEGVGEWSLMGSGSWGENAAPGHEPGNSPSYPDAYSLYYQGWIMPTVGTVADDVALSAHQSLLLGPNPGGTDWLFGGHPGTGEFFLLENRTQQGYDVSTPGCGIVIYRVDETVTPSNGANSDQERPADQGHAGGRPRGPGER